MKLSLSSMVRASLFCAFAVAVSVFFRFTSGVVPFSLLPLVVLLAGLSLSPQEAFLSMFLYLLLGLLGLPVFASAPFGGVGYVLKPTFGFLLGFTVSAPLVALLLRRYGKSFLSMFFVSLFGLAVLYPLGLFYLWVIMREVVGKNLTGYEVLKIGFFPFIGFDVVKAFFATSLAWKIRKSQGWIRREA